MSFCLVTKVQIVFKSSLKAKVLTIPSHKHIGRKALLSFQKIETNKYFIGSMTVEAALAMPIFLFFIANILSLFLMYESYSKNLAKIHQETKFLALGSYMTMADDTVDLIHYQSITPLFKSIGFNKSSVLINASVRKWTGYNVLNVHTEEKDDEYVYITENGRVYHKDRDCFHLKINIKLIDSDSINNLRNSSGGKYLPCEICMGSKSSGMYFVTESGTRYHCSASCSGLKRTIKTVKLSEVNGWPPCSNCGGS